MLLKQFVFIPKKSDFLEKELFENIEIEGENAVLSLKQNTLVGYSDSFYNAMEDVQELMDEFIPETIVSIELDNGLEKMTGDGLHTSDTFSRLLEKHYVRDYPDLNQVQIEMKGILKLPSSLKGIYRGVYVDEFIPSESTTIVYGHYAGADPITSNLSRLSGQLAAEVRISDRGVQQFVEISYVGVDANTGLSHRSVIRQKAIDSRSDLSAFEKFEGLVRKAVDIHKKSN